MSKTKAKSKSKRVEPKTKAKPKHTAEQKKFLNFINKIQELTEEIGWDIAVPDFGSDTAPVRILILGQPEPLEDFVDQHINHEVGISIFTKDTSRTDK